MSLPLPKHILFTFFLTAFAYLILVSFITYPFTTLLKPIPILCLIIGVLKAKLMPQSKMLMVLALVFSLLGDIVLTLPVSLEMELGIGFFLLAHCCYITLFLKVFKYRLSQMSYYAPVLLLMIPAAALLIPFLGSLLIPVMIYFCILMFMVFSAFQVKEQCLIIGIGAVCFMLSDLTLAFKIFASPQIEVRVFVMFSYYMAQLLLICGLVSIYKQVTQFPTANKVEMNLMLN